MIFRTIYLQLTSSKTTKYRHFDVTFHLNAHFSQCVCDMCAVQSFLLFLPFNRRNGCIFVDHFISFFVHNWKCNYLQQWTVHKFFCYSYFLIAMTRQESSTLQQNFFSFFRLKASVFWRPNVYMYRIAYVRCAKWIEPQRIIPLCIGKNTWGNGIAYHKTNHHSFDRKNGTEIRGRSRE